MQIVLALGTDRINILHVPTPSPRKSVSFCQRCWAGLHIALFPRRPASGTLPLCSYVPSKLIMHAKRNLRSYPKGYRKCLYSNSNTKLTEHPNVETETDGKFNVFSAFIRQCSGCSTEARMQFQVPFLTYQHLLIFRWHDDVLVIAQTVKRHAKLPVSLTYMQNHYIFIFNNMHLKHGVAWCPHSELQYFALINVAITANLKNNLLLSVHFIRGAVTAAVRGSLIIIKVCMCLIIRFIWVWA